MSDDTLPAFDFIGPMLLSERDALRAVVAKAIADLDAEHYQHPHDPSFCGGCGFSLPCPSARIADDLRKAIEP